MTNQERIHVLQRGQQLHVKWKDAAKESIVYKNLRAMRLTPDDNGNFSASAWVVYVDKSGVSVYIARGYIYGGDMEAFLSKEMVAWQAYFSPLNSFNEAYAGSKHYTKKFPIDFL